MENNKLVPVVIVESIVIVVLFVLLIVEKTNNSVPTTVSNPGTLMSYAKQDDQQRLRLNSTPIDGSEYFSSYNLNDESLDDPYAIAMMFAKMLDNGEWNGFTRTYNGHEVSHSYYGEILVDGEPTGVKTQNGLLYDKAKDMYLNGWDGSEVEIDSHIISISKTDGAILKDGYLLQGQHCVDLPEDEYQCESLNYEFIFGEGCYVVVDNQLCKYKRQELIKLPGEKLNWTSNESNNENAIPHLFYCREHDILYLYTGEMPDFNVYYFPDRRNSCMTYLGTFHEDFSLEDINSRVYGFDPHYLELCRDLY